MADVLLTALVILGLAALAVGLIYQRALLRFLRALEANDPDVIAWAKLTNALPRSRSLLGQWVLLRVDAGRVHNMPLSQPALLEFNRTTTLFRAHAVSVVTLILVGLFWKLTSDGLL